MNYKLLIITPDEMKSELLPLDINTSCGYADLSANFLIKCADYLCYPLAMIFNLSVKRGEFPNDLKRNKIVSFYKNKGNKTSIESYRLISIQPILCKLFERIINKALRQHIKKLIGDEQHGFFPARSTVTNLLCYSDFISKPLDDSSQVHAIYTDFRKAFDTVPHQHFLVKL